MESLHNLSMQMHQDTTYKPLDQVHGTEHHDREALLPADGVEQHEFFWVEYVSFFTIGMSLMWTWSMILQAVPHFKRRFEPNPWILRNFQAYNLVIFAVTISASSLALTEWTSKINYTKCLKASLIAYVVVALALTISASDAIPTSAEVYFPFVLMMVFITGVAYAISQQAAFAFVAGFGRSEYAPAILAGEALAALLPSVIEVLSVFTFPSSYLGKGESKAGTSILTEMYFFSGVTLGIASLLALEMMIRRNHNHISEEDMHKPYSLGSMWRRLKLPASSNFMCLCIGSVFPVFASKIISVVPGDMTPILKRPEAFIPLANVLWNIGDLLGTALAIFSTVLVRHRVFIFTLNLARLSLIPLYLLCNIDGRGSFAGDWFYLFVVQFQFGLTQGWLIAISMSGVPAWVEEEERESAGAFMGLAMVAGLIAGSFLALAAAQV